MLNLLINSLMKKQLFLVVVAALAMASCSKDESTGINNGNAIDFRAAMQTRASETTMANITNFFVTALDKNNAQLFLRCGVYQRWRFLHFYSGLLLAQRRQQPFVLRLLSFGCGLGCYRDD